MKKIITSSILAVASAVLIPVAAYAHVVVTPKQAYVGDRVAFSVSVPNEREANVTSLKLAIPKGVTDVMPDVIGGWAIATEKSGDDVTSITWTGVIPEGQRADFEFKAQAPAQSGELDWKAYQTYADGVTVSWDQKPTADEGDNDAATSGPYSVTKVVNDLAQSSDTTAKNTDQNNTTLALGISIVAVILSVIGLVWRRRRP
jgi:uncharacterized protein YcnI